MQTSHRSTLSGLLAGLLLAAPAAGQTPDLNTLALAWTRGRFFSPMVCERDGRVGAAIRRVIVSAGPRHARPATNRLTFHSIEVEAADRCTDELGGAQPDVRGSFTYRHPARSRPDLAQAEFGRALRADGGFDFEIAAGRLELTGWDEDAAPRIVDVADRPARFRAVRPNTDSARMLAGYEDARLLILEIEPREGELLRFHLVQYDTR